MSAITTRHCTCQLVGIAGLGDGDRRIWHRTVVAVEPGNQNRIPICLRLHNVSGGVSLFRIFIANRLPCKILVGFRHGCWDVAELNYQIETDG